MSYWKTTVVALTRPVNMMEMEGTEEEEPIGDTIDKGLCRL